MTAKPLDMQNAREVVEVFRDAARAMRNEPHRRGSHVQLPARGRLVVTGDLHDNPLHFNTIVRLAKLDASPDHHVVFQEMIHSERLVNGVDLSHRMLLRVANLVVAHPAQVHPLLANHELSQMTGKGVSKGAGDSVQLFNDGLAFVFDDEWEDVAEAIAEFIRAMPLALRSDSGVFCAHSLPAPRLMERFDPGVLDRPLTDADYERDGGAAYAMTWGRRNTPEQVEALAKEWNVRLFCLGHEHVETGCEMRGRHEIRLNSDHEQGAVLIVDLADPPDAEEAVMSAIRLHAIAG